MKGNKKPFCNFVFWLTFAMQNQLEMSKVIAGICTIVGGLMTLYFTFVFQNTSWALEYNDPKLHQSMFQTGYLVPLMAGILLLTVGLTFFFVAKESNTN